MNLDLSEEQRLLVSSVDRLLQSAGGVDRRRRLAGTLDRELYGKLGEMGVLTMRSIPPGEGGSSLFDAMLVAEQIGRQIPALPFVETVVAASLLGRSSGGDAQEWLSRIERGEAVVALALHERGAMPNQLVSFGAVADAVILLDRDRLVLLPGPLAAVGADLADQHLGRLGAGATDGALELVRGETASTLFAAAIEEWKLLVASELCGTAGIMLELAAAYATERHQFGRPIGSFQAVSHPLADRAVDTEAARLLAWWASWQVARGAPEAGAAISMAFAWGAINADATARRALHTFGGYGLSLEHNAQVYFRQANARALLYGDPGDELSLLAERLWLGAQTVRPDAGEHSLDFGSDAESEAIVAETRAILEPLMTEERRAALPDSYDGHDPEVAQALGKAGLNFADWPPEWGGRGASPVAMLAALKVWRELGYPGHAQSVTNMVGHIVREFATEEVRNEVVPELAAGRALCSMGYSEPGAGSDVFATQTKARWDEAEGVWIINGQKMFTTGANLADYVLLLTRTDPASAKHRGLTLFLVPMKSEGVEVHPIHTLMDERTNATFYTDVRLDDRYRIGPVNEGVSVMSWALTLEQLGAFGAGDRRVLPGLLEWARTPGANGAPRFTEKDVRKRLARFELQAQAGELLADRATWHALSHPEAGRTGYGPMSKIFYAEMAQIVLSDLMDMTAPESLVRDSGPLAELERLHRQAQVASVYAGSSEVHRSQVAEVFLKMPRSR